MTDKEPEKEIEKILKKRGHSLIAQEVITDIADYVRKRESEFIERYTRRMEKYACPECGTKTYYLLKRTKEVEDEA